MKISVFEHSDRARRLERRMLGMCRVYPTHDDGRLAAKPQTRSVDEVDPLGPARVDKVVVTSDGSRVMLDKDRRSFAAENAATFPDAIARRR